MKTNIQGGIEKISLGISQCYWLFMAALVPHLGTVVYALALVLLSVTIDFISGVLASHARGIPIISKTMRRSVWKTLIYASFLLATPVFGALLHLVDSSPQSASAIPVVLKYQAFLITWIELVSILENLLVLFPSSRFLAQLHRLISTEFLKYFK